MVTSLSAQVPTSCVQTAQERPDIQGTVNGDLSVGANSSPCFKRAVERSSRLQARPESRAEIGTC